MSVSIRWTVYVVACTLHLVGVSSGRGSSQPASAFPDAQLNDIFLLDSNLAWAAGDRGTILHSVDGGQSWSQQHTRVDARLTSIHFLDPDNGWAVGGRTRPHTLGSTGIVLATTDGGRTWEQLTGHSLPALEEVIFFSPREGIAVGRASSMQASGVFVTQDGGHTWRGVPGGRGWSWHAADFVDPLRGAVAGRGLWAGIDRRTLKMPPHEPPRGRAIRDLRLVPPVGGWAVGDGGLVLTTPDLGGTWFEPQAMLPHDVAARFDLSAVAVHGPNVWAAGAPGSRVFFSPDEGRSWHAFSTGTTTPIAGLQFVNATSGVAVGPLGLIMTTQDGGGSWNVARRGARRAPLLAVAAREETIPLELLAEASAADGYLAAVAVLFCQPPDEPAARPGPHAVVSPAGDDVEARLQEAALLAGATAADRAWRFPLPRRDWPDTDAAMAELDRITDGRALEQLEAYLVRQIRTWRPDVIVLGANSAGATPEDQLTRQLVLRAVEAAGDPTQHIDLATHADLAAWKVKRVYAAVPEGTPANVTVTTATFVGHLGSTIGEVAERARLVLGTPVAPGHDTSLQQVVPEGHAGERLSGIFEGIELSPRSGARRGRLARRDDQVQQAGMAEKRRNVRAIIANQMGNAALASHLTTFTEGLDDASQARVLYLMAEGYRKEGRWDLAAEVLERFVREYPDDGLVDAALLWLVQYHAGSETHWAGEGGSQRSGARSQESGVRSQRSEVRGQRSEGPAETATRAIEVGRMAAAMRPQLVLEPQVGVPLAAAYRRAGLVKEADRYLLLLRQRGAADAWQELAEAERWLAAPNENPPSLPIWTCGRGGERPHLDGVLDDPLWKAARPVHLSLDKTGERGGPRASFHLAYDGQFLYVGIRCPTDEEHGEVTADAQQSHATVPTGSDPRRRDEDLNHSDRIYLAFDLDRDLTTFYELAVDCRGRAHDEAWHDRRWNPTWYVAHAADEHAWTIEAAIPLSELSDTPPQARDVWCVSASHVTTSGTATAWQGPATPSPTPSSFGLLIFE